MLESFDLRIAGLTTSSQSQAAAVGPTTAERRRAKKEACSGQTEGCYSEGEV